MQRRDFDSTDGGETGRHFHAVKREIGDFADTAVATSAPGSAGR